MTYGDLRRFTYTKIASVLYGEICLVFKAMERISPYQTRRTWKIPRFSSWDNFKSRSSSLKAKIRSKQKYEVPYAETRLVLKRTQKQQACYMAKYASLLKPWSGTAHIKPEGLERYLIFQARITSNLVQALKEKYALDRNMKYRIRKHASFLNPEAKQPVSSADDLVYIAFLQPFRQNAA